MLAAEVLGGSFRDPSGFVFSVAGDIFRQVNDSYKEEYDALHSTGLYKALTDKRWLISHEEVNDQAAVAPGAYRIIKPRKVPFISYPYEWSFSQLQDAALLTLNIQIEALTHGMSLKDASAYNVQFIGSKPVFIDTLSFERYVEGTPWVAYQQFCQHFLAPLALMAQCDINLRNLGVPFINGVPLSLASRLLPKSSWLKLSHLIHIHLHARSQQKYADSAGSGKATAVRPLSKRALLSIIDSLKSAVESFSWRPGGTEWADYYQATNYSSHAMSEKEKIVEDLVRIANPTTAWDLGANNGTFSRVAMANGAYTVACDVDPSAVEKNYLTCRKEKSERMLPLIVDLTNPSPALGWAHNERSSLLERGPVDLVMGLALIHHLAISNNVPLSRICEFFSRCAKYAIIEFVPKEDSQVQKLLASRKDVFPGYTREGFEASCQQFFTIERAVPVSDSQRVVYLLKRK
jgi:ribosomal protein L11 methylase PrmA